MNEGERLVELIRGAALRTSAGRRPRHGRRPGAGHPGARVGEAAPVPPRHRPARLALHVMHTFTSQGARRALATRSRTKCPSSRSARRMRRLLVRDLERSIARLPAEQRAVLLLVTLENELRRSRAHARHPDRHRNVELSRAREKLRLMMLASRPRQAEAGEVAAHDRTAVHYRSRSCSLRRRAPATERRVEVEAWLAARPDDAERVADYRRLHHDCARLTRASTSRSRRTSRASAGGARRAGPGSPASPVGGARRAARGAADGNCAARAPQDQRRGRRVMARRAAIAHATYSPGCAIREVGADQEAHLVAWLSKRLGAPLRAPSSRMWATACRRAPLPGDQGGPWRLMYQSTRGTRITLYVRTEVAGNRETAFRYAREGTSACHWIDRKMGYALSRDVRKTTCSRRQRCLPPAQSLSGLLSLANRCRTTLRLSLCISSPCAERMAVSASSSEAVQSPGTSRRKSRM